MKIAKTRKIAQNPRIKEKREREKEKLNYFSQICYKC